VAPRQVSRARREHALEEAETVPRGVARGSDEGGSGRAPDEREALAAVWVVEELVVTEGSKADPSARQSFSGFIRRRAAGLRYLPSPISGGTPIPPSGGATKTEPEGRGTSPSSAAARPPAVSPGILVGYAAVITDSVCACDSIIMRNRHVPAASRRGGVLRAPA